MGCTRREPAPSLPTGYRPAPGTARFEVDGRSLIYVPGEAQIVELNETAVRIWDAVCGAATLAAAGEALELPLSPPAKLHLVQTAVAEWTAAGYLAPRAVGAAGAGLWPPDRTLELDTLAVDLWIPEVPLESVDAVFGHLWGRPDRPRRRVVVWPEAGQVIVYVDGRRALAGSIQGLVPHLKAVLTDLYTSSVEEGFLAHCALLTRGGARLLLSGPPGAGKTTLALALARAGWRYDGDDVVRFGPDGWVSGAPFAATVKSGSLDLLASRWPELLDLRDWTRADGRHARYLLPPGWAHESAGAPTHILLLRRAERAPAVIRQASVVDALAAILSGAYSHRWRLDGGALANLVGVLAAAVCGTLEYSDLDDAVGAIAELTHVQTEAA